MTGTTFSSGYVSTTGVTLTNSAAVDPVDIQAGASLSASGGFAFDGTGSGDWTITNGGSVTAIGAVTSSVGILLQTGGSISNLFGGVVSGVYSGIVTYTAVTIQNLGSITGTQATKSSGIFLYGGGTVANLAGGVVDGGLTGVSLVNQGVVTNGGTIAGNNGGGVALKAFGTVDNNAADAEIAGFRYGVTLGAAGTVINQGVIGASVSTGNAFYSSTLTPGITPLSGGVVMNAASGAGGIYVTNMSGGTIDGYFFGAALNGQGVAGGLAGSVANSGRIVANSTSIGVGVLLQGGAGLANAAGGTVTSNYIGVVGIGTISPSINNAGSITGSQFGVLVSQAAGTVVNSSSISGGKFGVVLEKAASTLVNSGQISSPHTLAGAAVQLYAGGTIINQAGGQIRAEWIGAQFYGTGTVQNAGTIFASDGTNGAAVWMKGTANITNTVGGALEGGPFAVVLYEQSTVVNFGTISGTEFAIDGGNGFAGSIRVEAAPGAVFSGEVNGENTIGAATASTLELLSGTGVGTIAGLGSQFVNFAQLTIDAGASWDVGGTIVAGQTVDFGGAGAALTLANPGSVAGTIDGFVIGDTLSLAGITDVTSATLGAQNLLAVTQSSGPTLDFQFDPSQVFPTTTFKARVAGGNTALTVACFAAGTRIATTAGPVAVEALGEGAMVLLAGGGTAPVTWVGYRALDCRRHRRPQDVMPVRVQAGAFGDGVPGRDLVLSPDHAVLVAGVLIPIRYLVNGRTVAQERVAKITYYHVELPAHGVLLAEGLACESYLDTGNRGAFANGGAGLALHPAFARGVWATGACAPLVLDGPAVVAARTRLLARASEIGETLDDNPQLRVMADGVVLPARVWRGAGGGLIGSVWRVRLPAGAGRVRLVSRRFVPAETRPTSADTRRMGVAIKNLALDGHATWVDDARLSSGWLPVEEGVIDGIRQRWRWTDGDAGLALAGAAGLRFELAMTGLYWGRRGRARHNIA